MLTFFKKLRKNHLVSALSALALSSAPLISGNFVHAEWKEVRLTDIPSMQLQTIFRTMGGNHGYTKQGLTSSNKEIGSIYKITDSFYSTSFYVRSNRSSLISLEMDDDTDLAKSAYITDDTKTSDLSAVVASITGRDDESRIYYFCEDVIMCGHPYDVHLLLQNKDNTWFETTIFVDTDITQNTGLPQVWRFVGDKINFDRDEFNESVLNKCKGTTFNSNWNVSSFLDKNRPLRSEDKNLDNQDIRLVPDRAVYYGLGKSNEPWVSSEVFSPMSSKSIEDTLIFYGFSNS